MEEIANTIMKETQQLLLIIILPLYVMLLQKNHTAKENRNLVLEVIVKV